MFISHVLAENSWIAAPAAWMRFRSGKWSIGRARTAVGADADERRFQSCLHVALLHHEKDRTRLSVICDDEIEESIQGIFLLRRCNFREPLALPAFKLAIDYRSNQDAARSAAAEIDVLPIPRVRSDFLF